MIDDRTAVLNLPLPNVANNPRNEDVARLREALTSLEVGISERIVLASTREALAGLHPSITSAYLKEEGRAGQFARVLTDISALVAFDSLQGVYVAHGSDPTGASGGWVRQVGGLMNPLWFGADPASNVSQFDQSAAFRAAAALSTANASYRFDFDGMIFPDSAEVRVSAGFYVINEPLNTDGVFVTWLLDDAAVIGRVSDGVFYSDTSNLTGRVVRSGRMHLTHPVGGLNGATTHTVSFGPKAQEESWNLGFQSDEDIGTYETIDGVARNAVAISRPFTLQSTQVSYTGTSAVCLRSDVKDWMIHKGMFLEAWVGGAGDPIYRAVVEGWTFNNDTYVTLHVPSWKLVGDGSKASVTPPSGAVFYIGNFHKVWADHRVTALTPTGFAYQSVISEDLVINTRGAPSSWDDEQNRVWGGDVTNAGSFKGNIGHLVRGQTYGFHYGYMATGTDVGFCSRSYGAFGASPPVGFEHRGDAMSFRAFDEPGNPYLSVTPRTISLGTSGGGVTAQFDMLSGDTAANTYDARIQSVGGSSSDGLGTLRLLAAATETNIVRPITDNVSASGGPSNRWSEIFSGTGTINTSDPRLKDFIDATDNEIAAAIRAVRNIPARAFQFKEAVARKGDDARIHFGVDAQEVIDAFAAEGVDARRFGLFCEDDEEEDIIVDVTESVPVMEEVDEPQTETEIVDGRAVLHRVTKRAKKQRTETYPLFKEDGSRAMVEQAIIKDGEPVKVDGRVQTKMVEAFHTVPVFEDRVVQRIEKRKTGNTLLAIRYTELAMLKWLADASTPEPGEG